MENSNSKLVSIVIPCYNEEGNISQGISDTVEVMTRSGHNFELICIDDGSKDKTWDKIQELAAMYTSVKGIQLMRNHGLTQAYMAGFDNSSGDYVITMAADLEIPAENLLKVIDYLNQGYDFVNTNRKGRWAVTSRSFPSKVANTIIAKISGVSMQDTGSGMKGFRKELLSEFKMYGEMHRFIPSYLAAFGAKMVEFDVDYKERKYGKSAYGSLNRIYKVMLDMVTLAFMLHLNKKPFLTLPGRLFGALGAAVSGIGGVGAAYLLVLKLMGQSIGNRPLFIVSFLMLVVGVQMMMMGMIGELLMHVYYESGSRKTYTVRKII